jgi:hypothetical protein
LSTEYPKHYVIGYECFDELMADYMTILDQMEFIREYKENLNYDVSISIGAEDYMLSLTIWKT